MPHDNIAHLRSTLLSVNHWDIDISCIYNMNIHFTLVMDHMRKIMDKKHFVYGLFLLTSGLPQLITV